MRRSNEIFFHHIRYTKGGKVFDPTNYSEDYLKFVRSTLDPHKGVTIAFTLKDEKQNGMDVVVAAYARCHSGSATIKPTLFNKREGRNEALSRLNSFDDTVLERISLILTPAVEHWSVEELTLNVQHAVIRTISQQARQPRKGALK